MRSNSPYPVRQSPYARSRSFSFHSGASSPVNTSPTTDAVVFQYGERTRQSPYPRRAPRASSEDGLDRVIERTHEASSSGSVAEESRPLLGSEEAGTAVYGRRWYLLTVFSLVALLQTMSWATWGPVSESAEAVFSWGDSDVTMCVFLGNLSFCVGCIPFSWLMDHKGLRVSTVVSCFFIMAGSGLRCLIRFVPSSYHTWCIYGGQMLNGVAGPVAQGGGALFSNLWFPNNQRATSTAVSTFIGYAGSALAFVVGPSLIPSPGGGTSNNNTLPNGNDTVKHLMEKAVSNIDNSSGPAENTVMMHSILNYLDYQAAAGVGLFLVILVYFPDRPPRPPSLSAATEREDFGPGLAKLLKNRQFWLISVAFCLSLGVFEVWDVVLDVNLSTIGISQETAGWLGFYCVMAGCVTGLVICRLADIFFRQIRLFLILAYVVSAIFVLWFVLIYIGILPFDIASIYAAIILSGVFLDGCSPLVYELICEAAYPVGEGVSSCLLQMLFVLVGMAFAAVQNVPNIGTEWMNWCLFGTLCAAVPLLFCVTDTYGRAELDTVGNQVEVVNTPNNPSTQQDNNNYHHATTTTTTKEKGPLSSSPSPNPLLLTSSLLSRPSSGYGSTSASCPPYVAFSAKERPVSEPHPDRTLRQDPRLTLDPPPTIRVTCEGESNPRLPAAGRGAFAGVRRNASYQGIDDDDFDDGDDIHVFGDGARRGKPRKGKEEEKKEDFSHDDVLEVDRSFRESGSSAPEAGRRSAVGGVRSSVADRSLLTSGRHSVDLSFLRVV